MREEITNGQIFNPGKSAIPSNKERVVRQQADYTYCLKGYGDDEVDGNSILHDLGKLKAWDRNEAAARYVSTQTYEKYYIKADSRGEFFDPHDKTITNNRKDSTTGLKKWRMQEVNKVAFEHYLRFLKTHNKAELTLARRSLY